MATLAGPETFTGADGTTLQSHVGEVGAWTRKLGSSSMTIQGNRLAAVSAGRPTYIAADVVPPSADYGVRGTYVMLDPALAGPAKIRLTIRSPAGGSETYYSLSYDNAVWELARRVSGSLATLGTWAAAYETGQVVVASVSAQGTALSAVIDGVERISATDSAIADAGYGGVASNPGPTGAQRLDTWQLFDFTTGGGGALVQVPFVGPAGDIYPPTLTPASAPVLVPFAGPAGTVFAPSLSASPAAVALPYLPPAGEVFAPSVAPAPASVSLPLVGPSGDVYAPAVSASPGSVVIPFVGPAGEVFAPRIVPGVPAGAVTIPFLGAAGAVYAPSITPAGAAVTVPFVGAAGVIYAPSVVPGAGAVLLPFLPPQGAVYAPTLIPGEAGTPPRASEVYQVPAPVRTHLVEAPCRTYTYGRPIMSGWSKHREAQINYAVEFGDALAAGETITGHEVRVERYLGRPAGWEEVGGVLAPGTSRVGSDVHLRLRAAETEAEQPAGEYRVLVLAETTDGEILTAEIPLQVRR